MSDLLDPLPFFEQIRAALEGPGALPDDPVVMIGYVPEKVPQSGDFVLPYVIIWPGAVGVPDEKALCGEMLTDALSFPFQTTSVGPRPDSAWALDTHVARALLNLQVGQGWVRPAPNGFQVDATLPDYSVTPSRHYMPRQWLLETQ